MGEGFKLATTICAAAVAWKHTCAHGYWIVRSVLPLVRHAQVRLPSKVKHSRQVTGCEGGRGSPPEAHGQARKARNRVQADRIRLCEGAARYMHPVIEDAISNASACRTPAFLGSCVCYKRILAIVWQLVRWSRKAFSQATGSAFIKGTAMLCSVDVLIDGRRGGSDSGLLVRGPLAQGCEIPQQTPDSLPHREQEEARLAPHRRPPLVLHSGGAAVQTSSARVNGK
mgnify:CR=1 FL=1